MFILSFFLFALLCPAHVTAQTAPSITHLSAQSGLSPASITITGTNFGSSQGTSAVYFGTYLASSITTWNSTTIVVQIPSTAPTGRRDVKVTVSGLSATSFFQVGNPPLISTASPGSGSVGTVVTVTGSNFGATQASSELVFGSTVATPTTWSNTSITVPV